MRIPRIFTHETLATGLTVALEEQASAHLSRVLRMPADALVRVFNGSGGEYTARISTIGKKITTLTIEQYVIDNAESPLQTHIAIGISKGEKMDLIVQKCTELGVSAIYPIITERSDVKMNEERWQKKIERWQEISIGACEQSGRNLLPVIHSVQPFSDWLTNTANMAQLIFHPEGDTTFSTIPITTHLAMAFGSEGGFSVQEIVQAKKVGCYIARLGQRVLRAETAPLAALAIAQAQWGDLLTHSDAINT